MAVADLLKSPLKLWLPYKSSTSQLTAAQKKVCVLLHVCVSSTSMSTNNTGYVLIENSKWKSKDPIFICMTDFSRAALCFSINLGAEH